MVIGNTYQIKQMELGSKLAQEIDSLGIYMTPRQRTEIIKFVSYRTHSLALQNDGLDKRRLEKDLQFRVGTLKQVSRQKTRDQNLYDLKDDFIKRQIFLALVEAASLIHERKAKSNIRDALAIDLHLWVINQMLVKHGIVKPTHTLASILKKVGYWRGYGASLKVTTIQNKILRASRLIQEARNKGACHSVDLISDSPRWHSDAFISTLSQRCPKCSKIWSKVLGIKASDKRPPWQLAISELKKILPSLNEQIQLVGTSLMDQGENAMPLEQIIEYLPRKYEGSFPHLFETKNF